MGLLDYFLVFLVVVPFILMNITAYRKERRKADEDLKMLLEENNDLLKELLTKIK